MNNVGSVVGGAIAAVVLGITFALGLDSGVKTVADKCDAYQKFMSYDVVYTCTRVEVPMTSEGE